jgi:L-asparagine oxygenase
MGEINSYSTLGIDCLPFPELLLTETEMHDICAVADALASGLSCNNESLMLAAYELANRFSAPTVQALCNVMSDSSLPFLLVRNIPIDIFDRMSGIPKLGYRSDITTLALVIAAGLLPFQYAEEVTDGNLLRIVSPISNEVSSYSSQGQSSIGFHTENAFLGTSYRPELLVLTCSANSGRTETQVAAVDNIIQLLTCDDPQSLDLLYEPLFRHRAPNSFPKEMQIQWSSPTSILIRSNNRIAVALYDGITHGTCAEAESALLALEAVSKRISHSVALQPGEALLIDNEKALHGRGSVGLHDSRYLQRGLGRYDLGDLRARTGNWNSVVFSCRAFLNI